jgi:hypothetical protein
MCDQKSKVKKMKERSNFLKIEENKRKQEKTEENTR